MDDEGSIEIAKLKPGQSFTLDYGNKSPVLTKLDEPRKFKMEDWYEDETDIWVLDDVIEEDAPVRYSLVEIPEGRVTQMIEEDRHLFGVNRRIRDFLGRDVGGIELGDDEEGEEDA
ncbi:MAG: hypothetical protein H7831_01405 [Magnetococcus sp. WYHC-3]